MQIYQKTFSQVSIMGLVLGCFHFKIRYLLCSVEGEKKETFLKTWRLLQRARDLIRRQAEDMVCSKSPKQELIG